MAKVTPTERLPEPLELKRSEVAKNAKRLAEEATNESPPDAIPELLSAGKEVIVWEVLDLVKASERTAAEVVSRAQVVVLEAKDVILVKVSERTAAEAVSPRLPEDQKTVTPVNRS